jgi:hypothetical protein
MAAKILLFGHIAKKNNKKICLWPLINKANQ